MDQGMRLFSLPLVGAIAGWPAGLVTKKKGFGLVGNIIIGVFGALVSGWLAGIIFGSSWVICGFDLQIIAAAFISALVVISALRLPKR